MDVFVVILNQGYDGIFIECVCDSLEGYHRYIKENYPKATWSEKRGSYRLMKKFGSERSWEGNFEFKKFKLLET